MAAVPRFLELLDLMRTTHIKKGSDYAHESDKLANFKRAATIVSWFKRDEDKVFAAILGIKLARLAELLSKDSPPLNESITDTRIDAANYFLLWDCLERELRCRDRVESKGTVQGPPNLL